MPFLRFVSHRSLYVCGGPCLQEGDLRWSFDLNSEDPQNPSRASAPRALYGWNAAVIRGNLALLDGTAFVCIVAREKQVVVVF